MDDMDPPSISQVAPNLYVGNVASSMNRNVLRHHNITAIVSLLDGPYPRWDMTKNREIVPEDCHMFVPCLDNSTMDILCLLDNICNFIDLQLGRRRLESPPSSVCGEESELESLSTTPSSDLTREPNVLIHCRMGVSRSAAVAVAYLMRQKQESLDVILPQVKTKRHVRSRENFIDQLDIWQAVDYQPWEDNEKKRPKSPYQKYLDKRAAKLAAKGLTGNEPIVPVWNQYG